MKTLFTTIVGSKLYGFSDEHSDTDIKGFGLNSPEELLGLQGCEQFSSSVGIGKDKIECNVMSLQKFFRTILKSNPTWLEILFTPTQLHQCITQTGLEIIDFLKPRILAKSCFKPYSAYVKSQITKLQRPNREGKRQELIDKFGYDTKFAVHAYRLCVQGAQVMDGYLNPALDGDNLVLAKSIRNGELSQSEILKILCSLDIEMYTAYQNSKLPTTPNFNEINDFLVNVQLRQLLIN